MTPSAMSLASCQVHTCAASAAAPLQGVCWWSPEQVRPRSRQSRSSCDAQASDGFCISNPVVELRRPVMHWSHLTLTVRGCWETLFQEGKW